MDHLLGALSILLSFSLSGFAQIRTDWERDGLKGRVHSISINAADLQKESGKYVEKRRGAQDLIVYDANGRKVRVEARNGDEVNAKSTFIRDAEGRIAELRTCFPDTDLPCGRAVYSYDSKGNLVEYVSYAPDAFRRELEPGTPETLFMKIVYSYDRGGRVVERTTYAVGGKIISRDVYAYDAKGDLAGVAEYDSEGRLEAEATYSHEFDAAGNWVKQTRFERKNRNGEPPAVPVEVTYRTITYY
jgi:hypothetical protein